MRIGTKAQFYALWDAGLLGNKLGSWPLLDFERAPIPGVYGLRYKVPGSPRFRLGVDAFAVRRHAEEMGGDLDQYTVCETPPDQKGKPDRLVAQGELREDPGGWYFYYSTVKLPMRQALALGGRSISGYSARRYVRGICTPAAFDDLEELLALYPGHVIEFTAYTQTLGPCRGRNIVVWEVRDY